MAPLQAARFTIGASAALFGWMLLAAVTPAAGQSPEGGFSVETTRLIPEDALFVAAWSGLPQEHPSMALVEEQLVDGDLREFYAALFELVQGAAAEEFSDQVVAVVATGLSGPGMAYVRSTPVGMQPQVSVGLVLEPGEGANEVEQFADILSREFDPIADVESGASTLSAFDMGQGLSLAFGRVGERFVLTFGNNEGSSLLARLEGDVPEWWNRVVAKTAVDRPLAVVSIGVEQILASVRQVDIDLTDVENVLAVTGLGGVRRASLAIGFDEDGYLHRSWLETENPRRGLLASLRAGHLTAERLPNLPEDTTFAIAMDLELSQSIALALKAADAHRPQLAESLRQAIQVWKDEVGIADAENLSASVGSPWTIYHSPEQGGWLTGFAAILPVKDIGPLRKLEAALLDDLQANLNAGRFFFQPQLKEIKYRDETIHSYIDMDFGPILFSWCLMDDALVVTGSPTTIKPILDRLREPAPSPGTSLPLADERASLVVAADVERLLGTTQGLAQFVGRIFEMELRRREFRERIQQGPRLRTLSTRFPYGELMKQLSKGDRLAIYPEANGIMIEGRLTLPGSEFVVLGAGGLVPVIWLAEMGVDPMLFISPVTAKRNKSILNLKMIGLAMHNYHDTYNQLPKPASTDEDGEPLLSWRVHLLPYLEQAALYQQFHLDEPWNSEHNLKLVEQIPDVFRAPNSKAEAGYTNYVTIRSPDSLFPPNQANGQQRERGVRFADVVDGLSNTVMVVEANDKSAVIWTKPDDLEPDMLVIKQIAGLYRDNFVVVMGDGAVLKLPNDVDNGDLLKLISRAGGEVVEIRALQHNHNDDHDHDHLGVPMDPVPIDR